MTIFETESTLTESAKAYLFSLDTLDKEGSLNDALLHLGVDESDLTSIANQLLEQADLAVREALWESSLATFTLMEKTGHYGEAGEEQSRTAFGRVVMGISASDPFNYEDRLAFSDKILSEQRRLGFDVLSQGQLQARFDDFHLMVLGQRFTIHQFDLLNRFLQFIGSALLLQGGMYGPQKEYILGTGSAADMGDYRVYLLEDEIMRSPSTIMAMAAVIGEREIFVRREALVSIVQMKWLPFLDYGLSGGYWGDDASKISSGIKRRVFESLGVDNRADFLKIEADFVAAIQETVLCHELGHGVIQYHTLPVAAATSGEATKMLGECVVVDLLEFLAEFAPRRDDVCGPLQNIVEVAKTDEKRAQAMFWTYFSDVWFFDTPDTYMYGYSQLVTGIFASCLDAEGQLDVRRLDAFINGNDSVVDWAVGHVVRITSAMTAFLEGLSYAVDERRLDYASARAHFSEAFEREMTQFTSETDEKGYSREVYIFSELFRVVLADVKDAEALRGFFAEQEAVVCGDMKGTYFSESTCESLRLAVFERCLLLGVGSG